MFDIGWPELMVIGVLTILVVGPKELPRVIRTVTGILRKIRMMTREFQSGLDDMAREADLADIKKQILDADGGGLEKEIEKTIDPGGEMKSTLDEMKNDLEKSRNKINSVGIDEKMPESREASAFDDIITAGKTGVPLEKDNPNSIENGKKSSLTQEDAAEHAAAPTVAGPKKDPAGTPEIRKEPEI